MANRTPKQRAVIEQYKKRMYQKSMYHKFDFRKDEKEYKGISCIMPPDFDGKFPDKLTRETLKHEYSHEVYD